jgi:hypothetical protein
VFSRQRQESYQFTTTVGVVQELLPMSSKKKKKNQKLELAEG